jgi:hypothetical protein
MLGRQTAAVTDPQSHFLPRPVQQGRKASLRPQHHRCRVAAEERRGPCASRGREFTLPGRPGVIAVPLSAAPQQPTLILRV